MNEKCHHPQRVLQSFASRVLLAWLHAILFEQIMAKYLEYCLIGNTKFARRSRTAHGDVDCDSTAGHNSITVRQNMLNVTTRNVEEEVLYLISQLSSPHCWRPTSPATASSAVLRARTFLAQSRYSYLLRYLVPWNFVGSHGFLRGVSQVCKTQCVGVMATRFHLHFISQEYSRSTLNL